MSDADPSPRELTQFELRMIVERLQMRIDVIKERQGVTVGMSLSFAQEIVQACRRAINELEESKQ